MVLLRTELGVGDVSARGVQTFDPGRGDGFRAQQQRVDPPSRRIVDLRRHGGDEPGGFQGVLPYLALEQCTYVLLGEPRGQIVREGAASSRRRRRTPEVGRLMPLQPCALDAHCPSSIKLTDLRLIHGRREARLMTSLLLGWALSTAHCLLLRRADHFRGALPGPSGGHCELEGSDQARTAGPL